VGNIFKLGTKFSEPLGLSYKDEAGEDVPVVMGSYGIGPSRLMGTVAEVLSDERGLVWPREVTPFQVHLVRLGEGEAVVREADSVCSTLSSHGAQVLYDDRDLRAGEKFADSDLIGIPVRVVISEKTMAQGMYEVVERASGEKKMLSGDGLMKSLAGM
jgi:prolyl-tRNA synthetase